MFEAVFAVFVGKRLRSCRRRWKRGLDAALLIALISVECLLANIFILKQTTLFGLNATCSDAFTVGATVGLNYLQEYFGKDAARKTIWVNFFVLIFYAIMSQIHLAFVPSSFDTAHAHYLSVFLFMLRIVVASFVVYFISQSVDFHLFGALKRTFGDKWFVARNYASTAVSQLVDTVLFTVLGLYGIVDQLGEVVLVSYAVKLAALFFAVPCVWFMRRWMDRY